MARTQAAEMRDLAVTAFFRCAFSDDTYPPENMERIFGVSMDDGVGKCVFNAWKTLYLRDKVAVGSVKAALAAGRLPEFFEDTVRSLSSRPGAAATHSYYTLRLLGEEVDMPASWNLPPGELFSRIPWERRVHAAMADSPPATGARAPTASLAGRTTVQPRRLFTGAPPPQADSPQAGGGTGVAVGSPVAEGVVLQAEDSRGEPVAIAQPVEVVEGSPLRPGEERMIRQHLDTHFVGQELVLRHLTSTRGRHLNGQSARVVGRDREPGRYRLHVSVNGGEPFRVLSTNLAHPGRPVRAPRPASEDTEAVLRTLWALLAEYPAERSMRTDMRCRVGYVRSHVEAGLVPPPTRCGDEIREREEQSSWVQTISHMRPCCHGDNVCDLRRFDRSNFLSLKEWVITGTCEVCQSVFFADPATDMDDTE
ncbi:hypothetical protein EMIHUDRAFT_444805 [Emiliania huxleyi CCMP1516]|uniref:Uncharacterized protein n=2 Tax=Emiliania huxleyi TaxID=2903 RepID=A0A0D3J8N9_EMIH1|nr:hypothetical protein EMIHUDRAFT_444805 [Emiliania huxleyi CCMP1516]EOD19874.1 hypothetical protein EMIHUDRAFT_444805 [Emiliania huxleyi CCMP1516]|eukprot:XP_005772303.1 hypothetical protein EMIHUDRAFT_444805 [Emiliania huxleyi CCMP1516]